MEELFPCGCTVCLNDGKLGRSISTAGADSIYSNQAVFEVLGTGFGRLRGHVRVRLDHWKYTFGYIEADDALERMSE